MEYYIPVLTGYIDEKSVKQIKNKIKTLRDRPIDIGYRARKLPYYIGKHGQLKYEIIENLLPILEKQNFLLTFL